MLFADWILLNLAQCRSSLHDKSHLIYLKADASTADAFKVLFICLSVSNICENCLTNYHKGKGQKIHFKIPSYSCDGMPMQKVGMY